MAGRFSVESIFKAVDRVTAPVSRMQRNVLRFTRATERGLHKVDRALSAITGGMASVGRAALKIGAIGVGGLTAAVGLLVREFSKVEDAQAAFTPLLGGAERARQAVEAINETAASTPFQFETLASSVNQLLPVMDGNIENTIKTLRMLGDTAGGNAQKLDSITRGYTKAMLKGKVDMESLNMIAEAGVPIFQDLADVMGMKVGEKFFKTISSGRVTTDQLTKAFEKLTGEGGKFFNGMEIASQTTSGLWSTLKDNISLTAAELGGVLAPIVKDLIRQATTVAQQVREWVKSNRELIATRVNEFVAKAKELMAGLLEQVQKLNGQYSLLDRLIQVVNGLADAFAFLREHGATIAKIVASVVALSLALKVLTAVMAVVNIVMAANPIGLIVLAITALIAAIAAAIIWWDEIKAAFLSLPGPVKAALAVLAGPIGWLIGAASLIYDNWEPIKGFFSSLWGGVVGIFDSAVAKITGVVDRVKNAASSIVDTISSIGGGVAKFFGFGGDEEDDARKIQERAQVVSPQERTAQLVEERRTTSTAEVTIKDDTGRAEVTRGSLGAGVQLQPSGAF